MNTSKSQALLAGALLLVMAGCASTSTSSSSDPSSSSDSSSSSSDSSSSSSSPPAPVCTPGMDQTCNDNPSISSLHGTCLPDGTCECQASFEKNPATGRCK